MKNNSESRILIISHNALSLHSNNGKTLTSIFSSWSSKNIAQLYFQDEIPESIKFHNFYRIRDLDILKRLLLMNKNSGCGCAMRPVEKVITHYAASAYIKNRIIAILRKTNSIKLALRDIIYGMRLWESKNFESWLNEFQPDSVFFVGGNSKFSFSIASRIADRYNIPLDVYITDDYVLNPKPNNYLAKFLHKKLFQTYIHTFNKARNVFVIGEDMANSFKETFHREFSPVMNSVNFPELPPRNIVKNKDVIDVVYAGGLHLGRDASLVKFGNITRSIFLETGINVKLTVYTSPLPSNDVIFHLTSNNITFGGALNQEQVYSRLNTADFVLHVESFDKKYINLTKLSISTKIPEYLASGACLIAYGPSDLASIRLIEKNEIGICITENLNLNQIKDKLVHVFKSETLQQKLSHRGFYFGRTNFDSNVIGLRIRKLLNA